jgi:sugar lactone lactonase YvrE
MSSCPKRCFSLLLLLVSVVGAGAQPIIFVSGKPAPYASSAMVSTLAGAAGSKGSTDATGAEARFAHPMGLAVAPDGTLFVVDEGAMTIRKITPPGTVTTLAGLTDGKGSTDGAGATAQFNHPVALAQDARGTLYVTDAENHTIRTVSSAGRVSTLAGAAGQKGSADGSGTAARFWRPQGIAVDANGTVYVADTENHTIRKITTDGTVSTMAGAARRKGSADGPGATARFFHPAGVAVDGAGNVYVADNGNHTIRKITAAGAVSTLAGQARQHGRTDGPGNQARFLFPNGVAVDALGNVYVADYLNASVRKISPTGEVSTLAGGLQASGHADGPGPAARFEGPSGIAVDARGVLYVTDGSTIRVVN